MHRARNLLYIICMTLAVTLAVAPWLAKVYQPRSVRYQAAGVASSVPPLTVLAADSVLNTGDVHALTTLPGVGEVIAERIIKLRAELHGFLIPEELLLVKGIGEKTLIRIMNALNEEFVVQQPDIRKQDVPESQ